jgi:hypothetical protein
VELQTPLISTFGFKYFFAFKAFIVLSAYSKLRFASAAIIATSYLKISFLS